MTYLDRIVARHRELAAADTRSLDALLDQVAGLPSPRDFAAALTSGTELAVISEIKRRSPSKGDLNVGLDPAALAVAYAEGGAACLSVLTDVEHFGGSFDDLVSARAAVTLPVVRMDFTVDGRDVVDARLRGADAVLLIVAALDDAELSDFHALGDELGLGVLVEIHDEAELERALAVGARVVGVNQRDLVTFEVDRQRAERVGTAIPDGLVRVAESGITGADDAVRLAAAGFHAVLVGEHLVTSGDPATSLRALRVAR